MKEMFFSVSRDEIRGRETLCPIHETAFRPLSEEEDSDVSETSVSIDEDPKQNRSRSETKKDKNCTKAR